MFRTFTCLVALVSLTVTPFVDAGLQTRLSAQEKKPVSVADFAGTWNIEVMSHQIALVIEAAEGNKVTATMMMMGTDVLLKGELTDRTVTLVGIKTESNSAAPPSDHSHPGNQAPGATPITVTLQDDGTVVGEMTTSRGPVTWTGEKLKTRKKS